jgi:hypothetical protein
MIRAFVEDSPSIPASQHAPPLRGLFVSDLLGNEGRAPAAKPVTIISSFVAIR